MTDDLEIRRRRAVYRACHRGTKEMDLILGRYAGASIAGMTGEELAAFERFIAMPDPVLTDWFAQSSAPEDETFRTLIAALRTFHGLAAGGAEGQ
jgi:antitoxin CptB